MQLPLRSTIASAQARRLGSASLGLVLLAAAAVGASSRSLPQDGATSAPKATPKERLAAPGTSPGGALGDGTMAADGRLAEAGRIPEKTSQDAADLWDKLVRSTSATAVAGADQPRSFELVFDGRIRSETGSNDYRARFGYLELGPGLVRATMLDGKERPKTVQMRGLGAGDSLDYWFRKLTGDDKTGWTQLDRRDYRESRNETDRWASISYDIARLTDPKSFRIVDLQLRKPAKDTGRLSQGILDFEGDPGIRLPDTDIAGRVAGREILLRDLVKSLVWLELATPDFKDLGTKKRRNDGPTVRRLVFGMDPKTFRPQIVIVAPHRTDMPLQVPGTLLVQCTEWMASGPEGKPKAWIPGRFLSYETETLGRQEEEATGLRFRFKNTASADLYLSQFSDMNAELSREDFLPSKD
ncbi:MAG: hypothetical protein ACJAQ3_004316 [Planctomycetota bacterium]|jgi:hypothetical protein